MTVTDKEIEILKAMKKAVPERLHEELNYYGLDIIKSINDAGHFIFSQDEIRDLKVANSVVRDKLEMMTGEFKGNGGPV